MGEDNVERAGFWESAVTLPPAVEELRHVHRHDFDDALTFLRALHPLCSLWRQYGEWIFRGHSDAAWALVPTVHRPEQWAAFATGFYSENFEEVSSRDRVGG